MSLPISKNRASLWQELNDKNYADGDVPVLENIESPWYVRLLIGFSGWLAAFFLLAFFGAAFEVVYNNKFLGVIIGSAMVFLGYRMLTKKADSDFATQFALAISFAGQALLFFSFDLFKSFDSKDVHNWFFMTVVQLGLAWYMPNSIHRVWSAFAAFMSLNMVFIFWHIYFIQTAFLMAIVAVVWLNEFKWVKYQRRLTAIGYGFTLSLLYQASTGVFSLLFRSYARHKDSIVQPWMGEVLTGLVILYVVFELLKRHSIKIPSRTANIVFIGVVILILASLKMFGITVGVMIIVLGFANGNRILTGLGIASLVYYVSAYYYALHTTLLMKSQLLLILGVLLLVSSWLLRRVLFVKQGGVANEK